MSQLYAAMVLAYEKFLTNRTINPKHSMRELKEQTDKNGSALERFTEAHALATIYLDHLPTALAVLEVENEFYKYYNVQLMTLTNLAKPSTYTEDEISAIPTDWNTLENKYKQANKSLKSLLNPKTLTRV